MVTAKRPISKWRWGLLGAVLTIGIFGSLLIMPLKPDGKFTDKSIASEGIAYFEFNNGEVFLKVPLGSKPGEGYDTKFLGTYLNENGQWVFKTAFSNKFILKTTLLSIHILDPNAKPDSTFEDSAHPRMMFWEK